MNSSNINQNFEMPKIPLTSLAGITSLTDLLNELPLPGPHPDALEYSLFAYAATRMPSVKKIASNNDLDTVSRVVEALSLTNTDEIVLKNPAGDTDKLDGLNVPPLLQAVLTKQPDVFYKSKITSSNDSSNIKHSSPAQAATPQSPAVSFTGLPMYQASPRESASEISSTQSKPGIRKSNNVQVAHSTLADQSGAPVLSNDGLFTVENSVQTSQEENPKICLKIRRKKKSTKEKENSSSSKAANDSSSTGNHAAADGGVHYGIVSDAAEAVNATNAPLKLKISRVKSESGDKVPASKAFEVSEISGQTNKSIQDHNANMITGNNLLSPHSTSKQSSFSSNVSQHGTNFDSHGTVSQQYHAPNISQHMQQSVPGYNSLMSPGASHRIQNSVDLRPHLMNSPTARPISFVKSKHSNAVNPPHYPEIFQPQSHSSHGQSNAGYQASMPPPPQYVSPCQNQTSNWPAIHQVSGTPQQNTTHQSLTPSQGNHQVKGGSGKANKSSTSKSKKKNLKYVRVKFIADQEEADIHKLSDIMYPDDSEVSGFGELKTGNEVVAKWPQNGKFYKAMVIDPLDNTGRKFRERKPPPKPFQIDPNQGRRERKASQGNAQEAQFFTNASDFSTDSQLNPYQCMADRIKLKRQKKESSSHGGKKRKRSDHDDLQNSLIHSDDEKGNVTSSPVRKISHKDSKRKKERRRMAEIKMMEQGHTGSGSLSRFTSIMELIFEDIDKVDASVLETVDDQEVPRCLLIPASRLAELDRESSKLKTMGMLTQLPKQTLVRLLNIMEPNIRAAVKLKPLAINTDITPEEQKWQREMALERVYAATNSALVALNVMTSTGMPKAVFIEDVIERSLQLLRFQLENTIYPEYDSVYKVPSKKKGKELYSASSKQKRAHFKGTKSRAIFLLYNKMISLMTLWIELLEIQPLTDTIVLLVSNVAIPPFFVENVRELQLAAIRMTTAVFARYERHRKLILDDILQSLARLPTSKRNLRNFRLNYVDEEEDDEGQTNPVVMPYIQMVSALVLQMIHSIVLLALESPKHDHENGQNGDMSKTTAQVDELEVVSSYDRSMRMGQNFLSAFLKKCASKSEEIDYRPLFENFIHDLLATVNKPEWPASEMMLSILGRLLVHTFSNRHTEISLRVASIDYLGVIAAKLRRDVVSSQLDKSVIKQILREIEKANGDELKEEDAEKKESETELPRYKAKKNKRDGRSVVVTRGRKKRRDSKEKTVSAEELVIENKLHKILLDYVKSNAEADPALMFAHKFYIGQWLRDVSREASDLKNKNSKKNFNSMEDGDEEIDKMEKQISLQESCEKRKSNILKLASVAAAAEGDKFKGHDATAGSTGIGVPLPSTPLKRRLNEYCQLSYENVSLITRYLASTRPFSHSFDMYLTHILLIREESAVAVRTRAIKCLAEIVAVDPSILAREDIWLGVQRSFVDASTSVREAAIDLIGKFILLKPDLVPQYYKMLTARILDTGVSVRKRVIKILRDLCHEHPDLPQLTDACVKMIRRVNDEDGIKKLVHEVFLRMWFTPLKSRDARSMRLKALSIADVVAANKDIGYEWIEQMMVNLIDTEEVNENVELACQQVVNCLVDHLIQIEQENQAKDRSSEQRIERERSEKDMENDGDDLQEKKTCEETPDGKTASQTDDSKSQAIATALKGRKPSEMIAATTRTLVLFAKIRPKLLVSHVMTMQPYLATKCESADELQTLQSVCKVLELSVPLVEHPGEAFLASLEEDLMKLILKERFLVVQSAISCLGSVTKHVTRNYRLVWDCFQKLCAFLSSMRKIHQKSGYCREFQAKFSQLLRTLFITGHFMKTFDFDDELMKGKSQVCIKDKVYECIYYFTSADMQDQLRLYAIGSLGLLMIQDPNMMFRNDTKACYKKLLRPDETSDVLKCQVLKNLQTYLQEEDIRMQKASKASSHRKKEDLSTMGLHARKLAEQKLLQSEAEDDIKETYDVSSGMASSVMQVYLSQVMECFFHPHLQVRRDSLVSIYLTMQQGLVQPQQCVPFVIAISTDPDPLICSKSELLLTEINKKYSGFIQSTDLQGIKMAYRFQHSTTPTDFITRGCRSARGVDENSTFNKACCSLLYSLTRGDRKHRRSLMLGLLKLFDDTVKTDLGLLLFIADNLAYFPYVSQDEPLYIISQIEVYVSVSGSNVLHSIKECLSIKSKSKKPKASPKPVADGGEPTLSESSSSSDDESDRDSDGDEEKKIVRKLPNTDAPLVEFVESSLACLLLLWVKQHLKTLFGFTDNKIHRYSPNEISKANDKQVVRKRTDVQFEPKRVINYLKRKRNGTLPDRPSQDPEYRKLIASQYLEFNELMCKLDPSDGSSDSDRETVTKKPPKKSTAASSATPQAQHAKTGPEPTENLDTSMEAEPLLPEVQTVTEEDDDSDKDSDAEPPKKETAFDLIRKSGMAKHKKKLLKSRKTSKQSLDEAVRTKELRARKKVIQYIESSSDENSDSDFLGF